MGKDSHYRRGVFRLDPREPVRLPIPTAVVVMASSPAMALRTDEPEEAGL